MGIFRTDRRNKWLIVGQIKCYAFVVAYLNGAEFRKRYLIYAIGIDAIDVLIDSIQRTISSLD